MIKNLLFCLLFLQCKVKNDNICEPNFSAAYNLIETKYYISGNKKVEYYYSGCIYYTVEYYDTILPLLKKGEFFSNNQLKIIGESKSFEIDGKCHMILNYKNGIPDGWAYRFDNQGDTVLKSYYKDGKIIFDEK